MNRAANHDRQMATTLAWEFWACGWRWLLSAPLLAMSLPCLIFVAIAWRDPTFRLGEVSDQFQFPLYWTWLIMLGPSALSALGKPQHRYTLPASNFKIIATLMSCVMATVFAQYAVMALCLNALFDLGWPMLGPSLLAAVLVGWCHAMLWSTSNSSGLQVLACAVSAALLGTVIVVWAALDMSWMVTLSNLGAWQFLWFTVATVICVAVGTFGFAKVRAGAGFDFRPIFDWLRRVFSLQNRSQFAPFSSLSRAQLWLEWIERGRALPVGTAVFGIALIIVALFIPAKEGFGFASAFLVFFLAPLSVIGLFFGSRSKTGDFTSFSGSRPLSNSALANGVLKSFTLSLITSSVVWLAFFALVVLIVGEHRDTSRLFRAMQDAGALAVTARVVLCGLAIWSVVGLVTALTLAGRRVVGLALLAVFGVWMAGVLVALCLPTEFHTTFARSYVAAWLVACVIAAIATYIVTWRRRLIFMPDVWRAALLISITLAAAVGSGWIRPEPYAFVLLLGCGLIPIPLAAAPLAVFVNRHR